MRPSLHIYASVHQDHNLSGATMKRRSTFSRSSVDLSDIKVDIGQAQIEVLAV